MQHIRSSSQDGIFLLETNGSPTDLITQFGETIKNGSLCVDTNDNNLYILRSENWELVGNNDGAIISLNDLFDIDMINPKLGDSVSYNGSNWTNISKVIEIDYNDLVLLQSDNNLVNGQKYSFTYSCVHIIPETSVLNINSDDYNINNETFTITADSNQTFNKFVTSKEYPYDIIVYDINNDIAEDNITPRTGKVEYRKDIFKNLSTYYDFRGVLFRRASVDTTQFPTYTGGQNWNRHDIIIDSGSLRRATTNITNHIQGANSFQFILSSPSGNWLWKNNANYLGERILWDTVDFVDRYTFDDFAINISVGRHGTLNDLFYNNIIFRGCNDITLGDGSNNCHFISSSDIFIRSKIENSVLGNSRNSSINSSIGSFLWEVIDSEMIDTNLDAIYKMLDSKTLGKFSDNDIYYTEECVYGSNYKSNFCFNNTKTITGSNINNNTFVNFEEVLIKNDIDDNIFVGFTDCVIGNNVSDCNFAPQSSTYSTFRNIQLGDSCENISTTDGTTLTNVNFGKGCRNIFLNDFSSISNTTFKELCSNIELTSGSFITKTEFGEGCSNIYLGEPNGSSYTISDTSFGSECDNFTLVGGSFTSCVFDSNCRNYDIIFSSYNNVNFSSNCTGFESSSGNISSSFFEPNCNSFNVSNGSIINSSTFSSGCNNITINNNSTIIGTNLGNNNSNFLINDASSINNSVFGSNISDIELNINAQINNTYIKSGTSNIKLTNGSIIISSDIGQDCDIITFESGSSIRNSVFEGKNENISGTDGVVLDGVTFKRSVKDKTIYNDLTYNTVGGIFKSESPDIINRGVTLSDVSTLKDCNYVDINYQSGSFGIASMVSNDTDEFHMEIDKETYITTDAIPTNIEYNLLLNNITTSNVNVFFAHNLEPDLGLTLQIGANETKLFTIKRVKHNNLIDKTVLINEIIL